MSQGFHHRWYSPPQRKESIQFFSEQIQTLDAHKRLIILIPMIDNFVSLWKKLIMELFEIFKGSS